MLPYIYHLVQKTSSRFHLLHNILRTLTAPLKTSHDYNTSYTLDKTQLPSLKTSSVHTFSPAQAYHDAPSPHPLISLVLSASLLPGTYTKSPSAIIFTTLFSTLSVSPSSLHYLFTTLNASQVALHASKYITTFLNINLL
jgi:hypothetical protein